MTVTANRLGMLKFQIEQAEANLMVCRQLGHDPNTFISLRVALGHVERFLKEMGSELGLGKIHSFAQTQFTQDGIEELKLNLRAWHKLVSEALSKLIPSV